MSDFRISQVAASPSMTEPSTSGSERKLDRPAVVLGARSICKSFGRRAAAHQVLFDVDVDVYEGECLAVIGGSGSGKSTLTRIMLGLGNADGGTVEYRGTPVLRGGFGLRRLRHDSGLIYQDPYGSLDPRWTVGDIVAEPLSLRRRGSRPDPAGIRENVHAALERVGLDAGVFIDRYPMDLSGGQAQRVAIARAIITEPDVILADERHRCAGSHADPGDVRRDPTGQAVHGADHGFARPGRRAAYSGPYSRAARRSCGGGRLHCKHSGRSQVRIYGSSYRSRLTVAVPRQAPPQLTGATARRYSRRQ